jgi:predicted ribosome quality control (RQC) complex YloA/Tae2 family protein
MDDFLELDLTKNVNENANLYYDKAKKLKKKIKTIEDMLDKGVKITSKNTEEKEEKKKKKWYEHFRWFYSEKNVLVIAGKNAYQNE